jgi:hypothetical protein
VAGRPASVPAHVRSATGGRHQDQANADEALRFGQDLFLAAQATRGDLSELEYRSARAMDLQSAKERGLDPSLDWSRIALVIHWRDEQYSPSTWTMPCCRRGAAGVAPGDVPEFRHE